MEIFFQYGANPNANISSSELADNFHSHHPRCGGGGGSGGGSGPSVGGGAASAPGLLSSATSAASNYVLYHYVRCATLSSSNAFLLKKPSRLTIKRRGFY